MLIVKSNYIGKKVLNFQKYKSNFKKLTYLQALPKSQNFIKCTFKPYLKIKNLKSLNSKHYKVKEKYNFKFFI